MTTAAPHLSRLDLELRDLMQRRQVAALGTVDEAGRPFVSMIAYAIDAAGPDLITHVSGLAAHSRHLAERPQVSLLIQAEEGSAEMPQALGRVTLSAQAQVLAPETADAEAAAAVYLARHPQAGLMAALPDFRFVRLCLQEARQVAGFGAARSLDAASLRVILQSVA